MRCKRVVVFLMTMLLPAVADAADWPQWRGPQRNGVAESSPPLATTWPDGGPKRVWLSEEETLGGSSSNIQSGSFGTVVVADGRVYSFHVVSRPEKIATRTLATEKLITLGWTSKKPPAEILAAAEEARLSPERQATTAPADVQAWALKWIDTKLTADQRKQFGSWLVARLKLGKDAIDLAVLDGLETIKDKPFASQQALDGWLNENKIEGPLRKRVQSLIPDADIYRDTVVLCMDAGNGKTVWKKVLAGGLFLPHYENYGASGTPCVANGKVYLLGTRVEAFCLDAKTGEKVWSAQVGTGKQRESHSSVVVADGVVAALGPPLVGLDADTGRELWSIESKESWSSPVFWRKDGKTYFIVRAAGKVFCVDPKPGTILWTMKDISPDMLYGGMTPAVAGDLLAIGGKNEVRLYRLAADKAEELWKADCPTGNCCSPTIYDGHVYVFAGSQGAACIDVKNGKITWKDDDLKTGLYHSPLVADGKFFLQGNNKSQGGWCGDGSLFMIPASPLKGEILGQAKIGQTLCASAAIVDGRIYCRLTKRIACYDLRAKQD